MENFCNLYPDLKIKYAKLYKNKFSYISKFPFYNN